ETTTTRARRRSFRPVPSLALYARSCFVLTAEGRQVVRSLATVAAEMAQHPPGTDAPNGSPRPFVPNPLPSRTGHPWPALPTPRGREDQKELRLGERLVKKFRVPARSQILVLEAFEEERWPYRIDNPLPPLRQLSAADRLNQAIRKLNRHQRSPLLRFRGDGS